MDEQLAHLHRDRVIAELADRQHGVVGWRQLLAAGLGRGAIEHRVRCGRLHRVHRGVYSVGRRGLTREGAWLAAVLACGDRAVLSHASAASLWDLRASASPRIDVLVGARTGRAARAAIRVHRTRVLAVDEVAEQRAIPVASVARTLLDLAATISPPALARAVERAETLRLFDLRAVDAALERHRTHAGRRRLLAVLAAYREHELTRSDLEARFRALCAAHGIPRPPMNATVAGREVDAVWRAQRLVAELDGRRHHATRAAFERDRAKDAQLMLAGFRVVRFTHRQVTDDPANVANVLKGLLQR